MRTLVKVKCTNCGEIFSKYHVHVRENKKLGHNFYCSPECMSEFKKTGKWLVCEKENCNNKFYRVKHAILKHNFCSQSCAAIINNLRYPKWPKRYCTACGKEFKNRSSKYCSSKCGWSVNEVCHLPKYTAEQIIQRIKKVAQELGRVPAKRELKEISNKCAGIFGSWNNAIISAGLEPHRSDDNRMYRRTKTKAHDGHVCDSVSEALIDNWLTQNNISHTRDTQYPTTNHRADWSIKNEKIFIEYFGLAKDSSRYDRAVKEKIKLCRKNKIKLIGIYPKYLYPNNQLSKVLGRLI